jgi:glyoxylase I family protein
MSIDHVLAVIPVADFEAAHAWYERLFGRLADNLPMEGRLVEWRVTDSGWVQVTRDADRAGWALLNFALDDLDQHVADVSGRRLAPGAIETVNKGVQLSAIRDPEGTRSPSSGTSASDTETASRREAASLGLWVLDTRRTGCYSPRLRASCPSAPASCSGSVRLRKSPIFSRSRTAWR